VRSLLFAPFAKLFELDFALNFFLILSAPVVDAFALGTGQFD
jgi:hypothetical protein